MGNSRLPGLRSATNFDIVPVMALNKWSVLDHPTVGFEPHSGQLEVMEAQARHKVVCAGRRFGKSVVGGHELLPYAIKAKIEADELRKRGHRREYWCVGPQYATAEKEFRVFWDLCKRLEIPMDQPGSYNSTESGLMKVSLWKGAFLFQAKSAQHPESLVGEALSGVIMAEAAKIKPIVWQQMIRPTLGDFGGWSLHTSTPEGKNSFYELYNYALDPEHKDWRGFRMPAWRNNYVYKTPTIDADVKTMLRIKEESFGVSAFQIARDNNLTIDSEVLATADELTIPLFNQEYAAEFTDFVGKVFKEFDEETHVSRLEFQTAPGWQTVAGVDYGFTNPNVWLLIQISPWGAINVLAEHYQENQTADEFADEIIRRGLCPSDLTYFYPDPASPGDTRILESKFRKAGLRATSRPGTGGELKARLDLIRLALKNWIKDETIYDPDNPATHGYQGNEDLRPQLMFDIKCPRTIKDMGEYRYPDTSEQSKGEVSTKRFELPMKKDDHGPEALGRFLAGLYNAPENRFNSGTRISRAKFVRNIGGKGDSRSGLHLPTRTSGMSGLTPARG